MFGSVRNVGVSLLVHGLALFGLYLVKLSIDTPGPEIVELSSQLTELEPEETFTESLSVAEQVTTSVAPPLPAVGQAGAVGGATSLTDRLEVQRTAAAVQRAFEPSLSRPLAAANQRNFALDSQLEGAVGTAVNAGSDSSSVDHLTREIRRQLELNKVLVCWVLDSTASMRERREAILKRFRGIYEELDSLGVNKEKALMTAVASFGQRTNILTPEPTADMNAVLKTVEAMKDDTSGTENIFSAVREVCQKFRNRQIYDRRTLMVIVLTDEIGEDLAVLDDTIALVKKNKAMVYAIGPLAPFGRAKMQVPWVDKPSGERFLLDVDRGPESVEIEHLSLPFWGQGERYDLFSSGFGPYGLTRLTHESGGLYFILDDNAIPGPRFTVDDLRSYKPDYDPLKNYLVTMNKSPLRRAVVEAARASRGAGGEPPQFLFRAEGSNPAMTNAQQAVAKTELFVNRALPALQAVEKLRDKESNRRWQAHYDLMIGRLLAHKVRCAEYNWALAQMKVTPTAPKGKGMNAWLLAGSRDISYGKKATADKAPAQTNVTKSNPKSNQQAQADAAAARTYLERVVKDHPDTPWAMMAKRELMTPLGFAWKEAYLPPPPKPGQPTTPQQEEEMKRQKRRTEAMKRVPQKI